MSEHNAPSLWLSALPRPAADGHKYQRGHCIVIGGEKLTGAARLAATAAARIGAGLTTIIAPPEVATVYRVETAAHLMIEERRDDYASHLSDTRRNALVLGPGFGPYAQDIALWLDARQGQRMVLDADGLTHLKNFSLLKPGDVLTPHAG
jgi:NAD(P)H-hydrate epimerase